MPWIAEDKCTGCGICIEKCPVYAISMEDEKAKINMAECIRCGICHDVCDQQAVRHDGEKAPELIEDNIEMTKRFMEECEEHLGDIKERRKCLERMIKYFNREKLIAEKTLEGLERLKQTV